MTQLTRLRADSDRTAVLPQVIGALADDGGVIVENMLGSDEAAAIQADLAAGYAEIEPGSKSGLEVWDVFHGKQTVRFTGLAARSQAFVDHALLNPLLLAVADALLLPNGSDYWLNTGQIMAVGPGEPAQYLHRDENNWPEAITDGRELTVSCMFALGDFTKDNGATVVKPGSQSLPAGVHRSNETDDGFETAYAEMPAGSGMIYTGKVIHGAGANVTDGWRYGMHVSFVVGWLRPEEASPLMVDRARAAELSPRARDLLGWSSYHSDGGGRTWLVDFEDAKQLFD